MEVPLPIATLILIARGEKVNISLADEKRKKVSGKETKL